MTSRLQRLILGLLAALPGGAILGVLRGAPSHDAFLGTALGSTLGFACGLALGVLLSMVGGDDGFQR